MKLDLTDDQKVSLKKSIQEGFVYQRFRHICGYKGNFYHKVSEEWVLRSYCPQCNELIVTK